MRRAHKALFWFFCFSAQTKPKATGIFQRRDWLLSLITALVSNICLVMYINISIFTDALILHFGYRCVQESPTLGAPKVHVKQWIFITTLLKLGICGRNSSVLSGSIILHTTPFPSSYQNPVNLSNKHSSYDLWGIWIIFLLFFYRSR